MTSTITQHVIPRSRRGERGLRAQRGSINSATATIALGVMIILTVAALSFFYLGQVQNTAGQGSDIQRLEVRLLELRERQKALELEGSRLRSIQTIEQNVSALNLIGSEEVTYLTLPSDRVARAD